VHDASSNFLRYQEIWRNITNNNVPEQISRMGDGTYVEFPLRVISTTEVDSRDSRSVQFCDILAGLSVKHFNRELKEDDRQFLNDVVGAGLDTISYNGIRPNTTFPDKIPPKRLVGPDVVDQMTDIIFGSHNQS